MTRRLTALFRATRLVLHIIQGLVLALAYPWLKTRWQRRILQGWSAGMLRILNVRVGIDEGAQLHGISSGLIVANHVSWLDVFILNAVVPTRFVAKSEVRNWPMIGWLCARAQTLFIERGKARAAARVSSLMTKLLQSGECLAVFPEGTTTDGTSVGHFHSSLLQSAIDADTLAFPVAIRYQDERGAHCTLAAFIGDMSFGASLWSILCAPAMHVRLAPSPPISPTDSDRHSLTLKARDCIRSALDAMHATPLQASRMTAPGRLIGDKRFGSLYGALLYPSFTHELQSRVEQVHQSFIWF
jgi:1-acyl-sn-glycerol-3-phosphate acyltransferase